MIAATPPPSAAPAEHRAEPWAGHRADPRAEHRGDPRAEHRADPRAEHRGDPRGKRRTEVPPGLAVGTDPGAVAVGIFAETPPAAVEVASEGSLRVAASGGQGAGLTFPPGARLRVERHGRLLVLRREDLPPSTSRREGSGLGREGDGPASRREAGSRPLLSAPRLRLLGAMTVSAALPGGAGGPVTRRGLRELTLSPRGAGLGLVGRMPLPTYLAGAVTAEMDAGWPREALRCQAVACRTWALAHARRHRAEGFDFCDRTHCQRWEGEGDDRAAHAVSDTSGLVLRWHGSPVDALFSSACGGHTASARAVFGHAAPALGGVDDHDPRHRPWCRGSPWAKLWSRTFASRRLRDALAAAGLYPPSRPLQAIEATDGDAPDLTLRGPDGFRVALTGYAFWGAVGPSLGWGGLPSLAFRVRGAAPPFTFTGVGLGHGVGMCQWGARGRAEAGWPYPRILAAYYPGATIGR